MSPVREAAPPWQVLIGPFAADLVEAELDHGAPLLLVPNDLEHAEHLARQFEGCGGGRLYFSRDLLGTEDREVCWYRYSDPRFDGVTAPEALHHLAPNLRLRDLDLRPVVRLDSLIHSWANRDPALAALVSAGGGRVWLQSKQPVPIVAGVSRVVEVIEAFCWTPLGTPVDPPEGPAAEQRLAEWLEASGFQPAQRRPVNDQCAAPSLVWRADPLRRASARQQQLEAEVARLTAEGAALRQEQEGQRQEAESLRQQLATQQQEAEAERQALQAAAAAERGEGAAERAGLETERAGLVAEVNRLAAERAGLAVEVARLEAEVPRLMGEGASLRQEMEAQREVADGLRQEVGRLGQEGERQRLQVETLRQQLATQQQEAEAERQALQAAAAAERGEGATARAGLEAEIARLGQENGTLRQELGALRQETRAEIAAILALLEPAQALSPDPAAPAGP